MRRAKEVIKEFWIYIVLIILIILIKAYIVTPVKVNGTSMIDTLHDSDIMILNKLTYRFNDIKRFDIVVIDDKEELIIKRVIGLPGEYIEYKNNKLYVNGKYIKEKLPVDLSDITTYLVSLSLLVDTVTSVPKAFLVSNLLDSPELPSIKSTLILLYISTLENIFFISVRSTYFIAIKVDSFTFIHLLLSTFLAQLIQQKVLDT